MPLIFIRNDITKVQADAIVNAANKTLLGGGGVDGAIHWAAGPELLEECRQLGGCETGQAKITKGYRLPAKYVIHTVGPIWRGGSHNEEKLLASCYRNSLQLALQYKCESVAFPLISAGAYGFPKDKALKIAVSSITDFLLEHDMTVYMVIFDNPNFMLSKKIAPSIVEFIDDHYVDIHRISRIARLKEEVTPFHTVSEKTPVTAYDLLNKIEDLINQVDETFSEALLRLIDEKGMTDSEVYKRANIDRKHFSKIRNDRNYKPSKATVLAFAIALRLNLDETEDLLRKAGYALSRINIADIIVEFFIRNEIYDIHEINEVLFAFNQSTLG